MIDGKYVGLGITTYSRFSRFKECFENAIKYGRDVDEIIIVEDHSIIDRAEYDEYFKQINGLGNVKVFALPKNEGVGHAKNVVLKYFYEKGYDYIFTLEDDINLKSEEVFATYIRVAVKAGIEHINFAQHGMHNKYSKLAEVNKVVMKIYPNIVGAFSLHTKALIDKIGFYDEQFVNAMEHVDYTYRASLEGLTTPFWSFCDVENNTELLEEQQDALRDSSIRVRDDWNSNLNKAAVLWKKKWGVAVNEIARLP
jgi:GT2 family glycosyltransferase